MLVTLQPRIRGEDGHFKALGGLLRAYALSPQSPVLIRVVGGQERHELPLVEILSLLFMGSVHWAICVMWVGQE